MADCRGEKHTPRRQAHSTNTHAANLLPPPPHAHPLPRFWLDRFCIDQSCVDDIELKTSLLPATLMCCKQMLVLQSPFYMVSQPTDTKADPTTSWRTAAGHTLHRPPRCLTSPPNYHHPTTPYFRGPPSRWRRPACGARSSFIRLPPCPRRRILRATSSGELARTRSRVHAFTRKRPYPVANECARKLAESHNQTYACQATKLTTPPTRTPLQDPSV